MANPNRKTPSYLNVCAAVSVLDPTISTGTTTYRKILRKDTSLVNQTKHESTKPPKWGAEVK